MSNLKEYIITLHKFEDLDSFYNDMESEGDNLYIPNRAVEVFLRRSISKNTHYMLTQEEANLISNDPRVKAVSLNPKDAGVVVRPVWKQISDDWSKSFFNHPNDANWGLLRCYEGVNRSNWGSDAIERASGTVNITASGKNVDIVIIDGHIDPNHPEFAVNADGTGGSRVKQFNWFSLTSLVIENANNGTYVYGPYIGVDPDENAQNNHGTHVAGIAAGNTVGWARDANIYNISPYSTNPNFGDKLNVTLIYDYINNWHILKPINPNTGIKNPTIINNSWATAYYLDSYEGIANLTYRGTTFDGPFTISELNNFGIGNIREDGSLVVNYLSPYIVDDVETAFGLGIVSIGAAGNESTKIDKSFGNAPDYNNELSYIYNFLGVPITVQMNYNRGGTPGASPSSVCVGAIRAPTNNPPGADAKASFSNTGPKLTVFAPGDFIFSSVLTGVAGTEDGYDAPVPDLRNGSYYKTKLSGTSQAAPQVTGLLACWYESNLRAQSNEVFVFLEKTSKKNQIPASNGGFTDLFDLLGANNRYLTYKEQRPSLGNSYPKLNFKDRVINQPGQVWPRTNIFKYGKIS